MINSTHFNEVVTKVTRHSRTQLTGPTRPSVAFVHLPCVLGLRVLEEPRPPSTSIGHYLFCKNFTRSFLFGGKTLILCSWFL